MFSTRPFLFTACATALAPLTFAETVAGRVVDKLGSPIANATVVVQANWSSTTTARDGSFAIDLPAGGSTVQVAAITGEATAVQLNAAPGGVWTVELPVYSEKAVEMDEYVVLPSRFPVGEVPGAHMTNLEAVLTPGSLGDVNRAVQTLPGVDSVDEGDALYVRGGDASETGIFINGARFAQVRDQESPLGTFVGSVDPFLADKIRFEAGGFGAARGNLLSGVLDVETIGRPTERAFSTNLGLGAASLRADLPINDRSGLIATAMVRDVKPILAVNGAARSFEREPHGHDLSLLYAADLHGGGGFRLFGIEQTDTLAVNVDQNGTPGVWRATSARRQGWATHEGQAGEWTYRQDASWSHMEKRETLGAWTWSHDQQDLQWLGRIGRKIGDRQSFSAGLEYEQENAELVETFETWRGADPVRTTRVALWAEHDFMVAEGWRVVPGLRTDSSNRGGGTTVDPRFASGYRFMKGLDVSASWGVYHQRPDVTALSWLRRGGSLPSQRAVHQIVAVAWERGKWQTRVEAYRKDYEHLALIGSQRRVVEGDGFAEGAELSGRVPLPFSWTGRYAWSVTRGERTHADTGQRAPSGISYSSSWIVQKSFKSGYSVGLTWRQAAGRRYTPLEAIEQTDGTVGWQSGLANSAKLRSLQRLDLLLTRQKQLSSRVMSVAYVSVSNVFGRANQYDVTASPERREQVPVRSILNRIIYVGFTLQYR